MAKPLPNMPGFFEKRGTAPEVITLKNIGDIKKGIHRAGDCVKEMKHTFIHGKKRGEPTHVPGLDVNFSWRPGFLYCNTGYPQHGKTEGTQYLALLKARIDGKKWGFYTPENFPKEQFFDSLAHTLVGKSVDPKYKHNQMSMKEYEEAIEFLHEHFFFVYYPGELHTPELIRETIDYLHAEFGIYGFIKDPWNKLNHIMPKGITRDDQYLAYQLPLEQQQARELDIIQMVNVHPVRIARERDKPWPVPDQSHIAGGQMWDNMADCITAWHRPNYWQDKKDTITEFHVHKMKMQQLMGIPGHFEFDFDRAQARYLVNGKSPLEPTIVYPNTKLPKSTFETLEPVF